MKIEATKKNLNILEIFSSETRIGIIELLAGEPKNIGELAACLGLSSAVITKHIQKMQGAGIVKCESMTGIRGMQKICSLAVDQVVFQLKPDIARDNHCFLTIPVGQYSSFEIKPTCGLSSVTQIIGVVDDPRYFADPDHVKASHIWFGSGWVEYVIPNYLLVNQKIKRLNITLEISSEAPGYNENWPSDIVFSINDIEIGQWTCPGDFGERTGVFTPEWWQSGSQYGLLKTLQVNETASFIDGIRISGVKASELEIEYGKGITFKVASPKNARNPGGINIFGQGWGNYGQDITVSLEY